MDTIFLDGFRNRLIQALFRLIPRQREDSVLQHNGTFLILYLIVASSYNDSECIWIVTKYFHTGVPSTYLIRQLFHPGKTSGEYVQELVSV